MAVTAISIVVLCSFHQAPMGLFPSLVLAKAFSYWNFQKKDNRKLAEDLWTSAGGFVAGLLFYRIALMNSKLIHSIVSHIYVKHPKAPESYTEKVNWLKINDRNPLYTDLSDKYRVRDFVSSRIGEKYLIPLLGVWSDYSKIDFDALPDRFVLKCTHDYGSAIIVNDKAKLNRKTARLAIDTAMKFNFFYRGREWAYKNIVPQIIAEKNIQEGTARIADYKFFCFGGVVRFMFIAQGRGTDLRFDFFDRDFNHLPVTNGVPNADVIPKKPACYDKMIELAEKLAYGISNVRVDLYNVDEKIYFGEMSFYHNGGMVPFSPYVTDLELGRYFIPTSCQV